MNPTPKPPSSIPTPSVVAKGRYVLSPVMATACPTGSKEGVFALTETGLPGRIREYARLFLGQKKRYDERLAQRLHIWLRENHLPFSGSQIVETALDGYLLRYKHIGKESTTIVAEELAPFVPDLRKIGAQGEITWETIAPILLRLKKEEEEEEEEPPPGPSPEVPPLPPEGSDPEEGSPGPETPEMPHLPKTRRPKASLSTVEAMGGELTDEELLAENSLAEKMEKILKAAGLRAPHSSVLPGRMTIRRHPMGVPKELQRLRGKHHGFVGAFRYPHRALLPAGDGMAFHTIRKYRGGTVLVDISGSMHPNLKQLQQVLLIAPAMTVAFYHGGCSEKGYRDGRVGLLDIIARNGRMVHENWLSENESRIGGMNVIDIPALKWLLRQPGPRFWVSDGYVTGQHDRFDHMLNLEACLLTKRGMVKQYRSFSSFVSAFTKE